MTTENLQPEPKPTVDPVIAENRRIEEEYRKKQSQLNESQQLDEQLLVG